MKNSILAVHLYNDFSGSPKVLAKQINNWQKEEKEVIILTSNSHGFLSNLGNTTSINFNYQFHNNKGIRLWRFFIAQLFIMLKVWQLRKEISHVYVNTLLPFGAAIAGKLTGIKVIYHFHETSINPVILKYFLKRVAKMTASNAIYVSHFLQQKEPIPPVPSTVVYNSLEADFIAKADVYIQESKDVLKQNFTCLMACSLKKYKGIDQYVLLAEELPNCRFELVLNASTTAINSYFKDISLPDNLVVFPVQQDMHWFYQRTDLVLNLSLPDQWVETFGMTLLEAMAYGKVVIGPTVGGPTEVILDEITGYNISAYDIDLLTAHIDKLATDDLFYQQMSRRAYEHAQSFRPSVQRNKLINELLESPLVKQRSILSFT